MFLLIQEAGAGKLVVSSRVLLKGILSTGCEADESDVKTNYGVRYEGVVGNISE